MNDRFITVVVVPTDGLPYTRAVRYSLKSFKEIVNGPLDRVMYPIKQINYDIVINDEGLLVDNPMINPVFCQLPGTVFITKPSLQTGEWQSLTIEDELTIMAHLRGLDKKQEQP